ncbi:MAG: aldehyde dehydrogenase family protein [Phycisphaerae bacterium]|nr:aldehyde dehydrogenase family protein [Phycisphaerae bacterium]MDW8262720.1 aldehyde dehydrogenase family protein [Phycisphaerales bacterium]
MARKQNTNGRSNGHVAVGRAPALRVPDDHGAARLPVLKTYKIFIGGKFPRTESGRYYLLKNGRGEPLANVCLCTRKDFRDAVVAARNAQTDWARRSAYNRSQILYRIAEMLEGRSAQFVDELVLCGATSAAAVKEVQTAIDRVLYYAGWCDKYQQVFSSVNPVASSHFNFSILEPVGVVAAVAPEKPGLLGLISITLPAICGANTVVALASYRMPLPAVTFAEVLATSDLPGGVVNILTGTRHELVEHFASHMDVNALIHCGSDAAERKLIQEKAAQNVKRLITHDRNWFDEQAQSPYFILDLQEIKTTWHPIGL